MADCKLEMIDGNIKTINARFKIIKILIIKIHTQYSICEGAIKIDNLKDFCKENKIPCLGLSDTSNLCGALEFAEIFLKLEHNRLLAHKSFSNLKTQLDCYHNCA